MSIGRARAKIKLMIIRTRFAPSPTGFLHVGGIYSALIDYAFAKKNRGQFILRIEDTDQKRFVAGAEDKIYEWLAWVGINPDEGPKAGGSYGPYRQSERLEIYQKYARELVEAGHAYYCFCSVEKLEESRVQQQKSGKPPMYDRCCRHFDRKEAEKRIATGEKYVIRMKIPDNEKIIVDDLLRGEVIFESQTIDDQVLIKSDGYPTYHLAVVVDDHLMEVTHVVRGEEWLSSAPKHVLLYRYFGWQPPVFVHTAVIRNPDKSKLSKRQGHTAVSWYIENGYLPEALINFLCLLGWSHPEGEDVFSIDEFIKNFDPKDLSPVGPVFNLEKLNWLNGVYIRQKTDEELMILLKPFWPKGISSDLAKKTLPLVKERLVRLSDYPTLADFFLVEPEVDKKLLLDRGGKDTATIVEEFKLGIEKLKSEKGWTAEALEKVYRNLAADRGYHIGKFFMATRIAITGKTATPPLFATMEVLGREKTIARLRKASLFFLDQSPAMV